MYDFMTNIYSKPSSKGKKSKGCLDLPECRYKVGCSSPSVGYFIQPLGG